MSRRLRNIVGERFGRLNVLKSLGKQASGHWVYLCKCDCGKEKRIRGTELISGITKSCGCLKEENLIKEPPCKYEIGKGAFNKIYSGYKRGADRRGLNFNLTEIEFKELTQQNCYYCGSPPSSFAIGFNSKTKYNGNFIYNGVDRKDNTLGYTKENSITCCKKCNFMKSKLSYEDFIEQVTRIFNKLVLEEI